MTASPENLARLQFLARVVARATQHLETTTARLFTTPMTPERIDAMVTDQELAERVDAFVSRFGRLQDMLGDKLLPLLLAALGEQSAPMIDRLDRAERLGLIPSTERWMVTRRLRNRMIHDYVEDPLILADALNTAHREVPMLINAANRMTAELTNRRWA